ncbi:MAG TPA: multicopper oxidase family protein [Gammaproteobacteria bacterium]|nr:multicopper oxidase family protein [Gammaproteobacteria bacterium]
MNRKHQLSLSRRQFLLASAAVVAGTAGPWPLRSLANTTAAGVRDYHLKLHATTAPLLGAARKPTDVWAYNAQVPGPLLRARQGERLRVVVENRLPEDTTVHWHGIRVPNDQDGVPHLTQEPIAVGGHYVYEFECPDAGTFWYHPHQRSHEQVDRGLYGPLIIEEPAPIRVDRDLTWVLDDWRLDDDGQLSETFGHRHDISHAGRIGNTITVNGGPMPVFALRSGERIRLRLINAANARIFSLNFAGHAPSIIAYDGQPVTPHQPTDGQVLIGPAMRIDLILDATGKPGERYQVIDSFYRRGQYELLELVYAAKPLRDELLTTSIRLPANPLAEPDLQTAEWHEIRFQGGMMGNLREATLAGKPVNMMQMMRAGKAWAINGIVATGHVHEPILTLERNRSYRLRLINDTAWHHPMHLHGHSFRVLSRSGQPTMHREWQDTVLMSPQEEVEIAFAADNPGDWMFHCHILEHQLGGMMAVIRVA